jgi:hypothetical protein
MNARHDASYKHLFSSPKVVRHLVEGFIPDEEIKRLDFSTLERMNASHKQRDTHLFHVTPHSDASPKNPSPSLTSPTSLPTLPA